MRKINEAFICQNCGAENPEARKTCRNHCRNCLHSLHIDKEKPGDRKSDCKGIMIPTGTDQNAKKGIMIIHKCVKCGKVMKNKIAEDDSTERIIEVSTYGFTKINKK